MRLILAIAIASGLAVPALAQEKAPPSVGLDEPGLETENPKPESTKTKEAEAEVTKYGDWFVGCRDVKVDGGEVKVCEMQQVLEETNSGKAFLRISLIYPRNSAKPVIRIFTPLGVLLQKGIKMQIDNGQAIVMPFAICVANPPSCVVDGAMEESLVTAMKRGSGGKLTMSFAPDQTVVAPFSLTGFTKSINAIAPN